MAISIWATKCRHCGEEVGRPRHEEQKVTIKDLGGESASTYTLSGNVKDALEAFRAEQDLAREKLRSTQRSGSWLGGRQKQQEPAPADPKDDSFMKLDAAARDLSRSITGDVPKPRAKEKAVGRAGNLPESVAVALRIGLIAVGVVFGLLVLYAGYGKVRALLNREDTAVRATIQNEALIMLNNGRPLIDAFEEAVRVAAYNKTESDRKILDQVRAGLVSEVQGMISKRRYLADDLYRASRLVDRAVTVEASAVLRDLKEEVDDELDAYNTTLRSIDPARGVATVNLFDDDYRDASGNVIESEEVRVGDSILRRFYVQSIKSAEGGGLVLQDNRRGGRLVQLRKTGDAPYAF